MPEEIRWISAATEGRIERVHLQPGSPVSPSTILVDLSNAELERDALDAEWQLKASQAELANVRVGLQRDLMDQQAEAARVQSDYRQAVLQAETNQGLFKEGLLAEITLKLSNVRAEELATRNEIEKKRIAIASDAARAQIEAQQARVEQLRALSNLKRSQLDALRVRAGLTGVLREVPVQIGQRVAAGTILARVVQPERLKAELRIAETQVRDVLIGQPASIDTRNGLVAGHVSRVDVLADVSRPLREGERQAWQRIIRVLGHELNNSLTPIHSIATSLRGLLSRPNPPSDWREDMEGGLGVIASRAEALFRFTGGYAQLARLPPPRFERLDLGALVARVASLETRLPVHVRSGPSLSIAADPDQLEQLLINLLRNAVDAALETSGGVEAGWKRLPGRPAQVSIWVSDDGPGLTRTDNLFVPFFTTKPGGSGIGLVLSREIAEAHGGSLSLSNRRGQRGCRAELRLPL